MRYLVIVSIALLSSIIGKTQSPGDVTNVSRLTILSPGLSYEHRIGKLQTLKVSAFMAASFGYSYSSSLGSEAYLYLDPAISLEYRYYYNFRQRSEKGKRTEMNSLNYIGPVSEVIFTNAAIVENSYEESKNRAVGIVGGVWGFQRNYAKRFSLDLNLGLGYQFGRITEYQEGGIITSHMGGTITPIGELSLGIWLNKRR